MTIPTSTSPRSTLWTFVCWLVIGGFVAVTFWSQTRASRRTADLASSDSTPNLPLEITGRIAVAQADLMDKNASVEAEKTAQNLRKQLQHNLLELAVSPPDQLKAVIAIRELLGNAAAIDALNAYESALIPHPIIHTDAEALKEIYQSGPATLSTSRAKSLRTDLGWFGELALTQGLAADAPARVDALRVARRCYIAAVSTGVSVLLALGLGFLLLILLIVLFCLGKLRFGFEPGTPNAPPMFLESFALWGVSYLVMSLALHRFKVGRSPLVFESLFVVITGLVAIWPLLRGCTWPQLRHALGWHTGRGIFREIGAGLLGYIAGLPILLVGLLLTLLLSKLGHANPTHPIQQEFAGPLPLSKILALLLTISVGAPLLEETMFRGALYFHLRRRWRPWLSAGVVALIFAAIHPQGWAGIPVLASIALTLALLREWRGSLLASVTAHGINNGVVLMIVVLMLR